MAGLEYAEGLFLLQYLYKQVMKIFVRFVVVGVLGTAFATYQDKENRWSSGVRETSWRVYRFSPVRVCALRWVK